MQQKSRWYIRVFVGISGWISSLFVLFLFAMIFKGAFFNSSVMFMLGILLVFGAYLMFLSADGDFIEQVSLANAFAGEALMSVAIFNMPIKENVSFLIISIIFAILMLVIPYYIHRFLSAIAMSISFFLFLKDLAYTEVIFGLFGIVVFVLLLFRDRFKNTNMIEAILYGLLSSFIFINYADYKQEIIQNHMPIEFALGGVVGFATWKILASYDLLGNAKVVSLSIMGVLLTTVLSFWVHNLMLPVAILVIAFWQQDKKLIYLSILLGLFSLSRYYYFAGDTLLDKSKLLLLSSICFAIAYGTIKALFKKDIHV